MKEVIHLKFIRNNSVEIKFPYNMEIIKLVKTIPGRKYLPERKIWIIPDFKGSREDLIDFFDSTVSLQIEYEEDIKPVLPEGYKTELDTRRYSRNTKRAYTASFSNFIYFYRNRRIRDLSDEDVNTYINHLVVKEQVSPAVQKQAINAIKFYYEKVIRRKVDHYKYKRPKREKSLPQVLSEKEVAKILNALKNPKHRTILTVIYSAGLRLSELINLKLKDIDWDRKLIRVKMGKGRKDRYTLLSAKLEKPLQEYISIYKPADYLFEGQNGGKYSAKSVQNVLKNAATRAGITKHATVHTLSYANLLSFLTFFRKMFLESKLAEKRLA